MSPKRDVLTALLRRFPNAPSASLARRAYKENPKLWPNVEAARTSVRYLRGASGHHHRAGSADKSLHRTPQRPGDPFGALPEGLVEGGKAWHPFEITGAARTLVLSDVHVPYHDRDALTVALTYGHDRDADHILLNGDILDFFSVSRWEKDPRERDFARELQTGRDVLEVIRKAFPKARIVFKLGNHEERWERYLFAKAPELLGVADFQLEKLLRFDEYKIECVADCRPIRLGRLNVVHGHEYRFGIQAPVNPARGFYLRAKAPVLGGHLHQTSQHSEKNLEGNVISAWSTGCLCNMTPAYARINNWNLGFAYVETDKDGVFEVQNLRIIKGKAY